MSKTVQPIKIRMMPAEDVPIGKTFALDGVRYIKLSDDDSAISHMSEIGVLATTVLPLCLIDTVYLGGESEKSLEERAVCMFMTATCDYVANKNIITHCMPDADDFRMYRHTLSRYIKDAWYVDNGVEDVLKSGEYLYVDEHCELCRGNEYHEKEDGVSRRLGIRAFYAIDPDVLVTVRDYDLEGAYRCMPISNQEAAARIRRELNKSK